VISCCLHRSETDHSELMILNSELTIPPKVFGVGMVALCCGTRSSGIGCALNNRWHGFANKRAMVVARLLRALSVAIPVFAYICRYSFEIKIRASRALNEEAQLERFHTEARL